MGKKQKVMARKLILDEAEKLFSERGYFKVTAKEVSEAAGVNTAAVNYYFGGKDGLYLEVLNIADQKMVSEHTLDKILEQKGTAKEKLRCFLEIFIGEKDPARKRAFRLFLLEIASPSTLVEQNMQLVAFPKMKKFSVLISEITGFDAESSKLMHATGFALLQSISFMIFPNFFKNMLFGENFTESSAKEKAQLIDSLTEYVYGGLEALKKSS